MRVLLIVLLALLLPSGAKAAWREASTPHFLIYSEESAASLQAFATRLERFDQMMRMMRKMADPPVGPSNRLIIYVVPSLHSVQRVAGKNASNISGFYIPRASGSIAIVPRSTGTGGQFELDAQSVLLHEYTHHFMMSEHASAAYPAWYVEGFAEFNSTTEFKKDGSIGIGLPALHRAYGLSLQAIGIEKLLTGDTGGRDPELTESFYSRSWLLTHYLNFEKARKGQLASYLKAINEGKESLAAAREIFGDLKKLDAELNKYKSRSTLPYIQFGAKEIKIGAIAVRELSRAEDALMELRIRSDRGVTPQQAAELVVKIRKAAQPFASDAAAQTILAEAEYDAGNYAAAEAAADRALAADPQRIDALLYKGRAIAGRLAQAKNADQKAWRDVRGWFLKANKLDPEHAEPLFLFYNSFGEHGARPTTNAVAGLIKAHDLAPQDRGLRMQVAREHLMAGKTEETRATLAPIAFDPHAGEMGKFAAALLTSLQQGGAKAAIKVLEAEPAAKDEAGE